MYLKELSPWPQFSDYLLPISFQHNVVDYRYLLIGRMHNFDKSGAQL